MEGTFGADRKSVIFLGKGNLIHITGPLTGSLRPVAVLDTEKGKDRMPGRILVRTAISGKTGGDIRKREKSRHLNWRTRLWIPGKKRCCGAERGSAVRRIWILRNGILY